MTHLRNNAIATCTEKWKCAGDGFVERVLERFAKLEFGAVETGFDGVLWNVEQRGGLFDAACFNFPQHKNSPKLLRQLRYGNFKESSDFFVRRGLDRVYAARRVARERNDVGDFGQGDLLRIEGIEGWCASLFAEAAISFVEDNAREPCFQIRIVAELFQVLVCVDVRVLHCVFGVLIIVEHTTRHSEEALIAATHDVPKSYVIPRRRPLRQIVVVECGVLRVSRRCIIRFGGVHIPLDAYLWRGVPAGSSESSAAHEKSSQWELFMMARLEGFEPPTNGFGSHYSIRLSYRRKSVGCVF